MTLRHYAKFRNEEVIILGYRKSMNAVMICRLTGLPADEQAALRQIASSSYAQSKCDYLIPVLGNERHKSGEDWFTYLARRLHRNDGTVAVIPFKEMMDMDTDQKAFFKGYGRSVDEAKELMEKKGEQAQGLGPVDAGDDYKPINPLAPTPVPGMDPAAPPVAAVEVPDISPEEAKPYVDREAMMLQLMQQMVEGQQKVAESITALERKVTRKTVPKKRIVRRKPAAKVEEAAVEPAPELSSPSEGSELIGQD